MPIPSNRLSCATVTLGGTFIEKLHAMQAAGFGALEILSRDLFESLSGAEVAIAAVQKSGLQIACLQLLRDQEGAPDEQRALKRRIAENVMGQMGLIGARTLIVCSNVDPVSSGDPGRMRDDLYELGELAKGHGVRIAYEALCWGRWVSDYREAWKLIQQVGHDHVGLMLDSAHIGGVGATFEAVEDIDPDKIFLVELNDLPTMRLPAVDISRYYRMMPGEGVLDLPDFIRRLERIGYDGLYSLEAFNDHYRAMPPGQVAEHAFRTMNELLGPFGPAL